jgi:hypothetical protein
MMTNQAVKKLKKDLIQKLKVKYKKIIIKWVEIIFKEFTDDEDLEEEAEEGE